MRVTIDNLAERRLWAFIKGVKVEVGGMGYANLQDDTIHWSEAFLIPQEVSSSEVDFESTHGDQVAIERAEKDGVLDDPNFVWVSWHSHHTMKPFWSSTDDKRIAAMKDVGVKRLLSFVGCHDTTYEMRLDVFGVQAHDIDIGQVTISKLSLTREVVEKDDFAKQIEDELDTNVKEIKYRAPVKGGMTSSLGFTYPSAYDKNSDQYAQRIVKELIEDGYTRTDAEDLIDSLGIDDCELLLDSRYITGMEEAAGK